MEVQLKKILGLKGVEVSNAWVATVYNDMGSVAFQEKGSSAAGSLDLLKRKIEETLRAVEEMRPQIQSSRH